jgi:hypothetical protein
MSALPSFASARNRFPAFRLLYLPHAVERFGQLDNVGVLGIHLKKIDQVASARAVEDAFHSFSTHGLVIVEWPHLH